MLTLVVIMGHLPACSLVATLDIETLVCLAAVEDGLVTPNLLRNVVEGIYYAETQLLALLRLVYGDILNMACRTKRMNAASTAN